LTDIPISSRSTRTEARTFQCAHCQHSNTVLIERGKDGRWATVGKAIAALVPIASLVVGTAVTLSPTETTDIGKARAFLNAYYGNAPYEPDQTWNRLSDSFKKNGESSADKLTHEKYDRYFRQFRVMTVSNVANYDGRSGEWYVADIYRLNKNGDSATTRYAYQLQCPWEAKLPWVSCSPDNIQILNVCVVQASGRCREDEGLTGVRQE
jgi:hypothetical protein